MKFKDIITLGNVLTSPKKMIFIWSIILYFPIISFAANGVPIDNPYAFLNLDEVQTQLIETLSTTLGIIGSISYGIFYLKKSSDTKHTETREMIERLDEKLCKQIERAFKDLETNVILGNENQEKIFYEKINNIQTQIINLKDRDRELNTKINRVENKIFDLRSEGGHQED